ncbi:MAG: hypothetical protein QOE36_3327 [Gaiellaceae bacterium]|jgi:hypothetical protein|nr:hypothetical protein [Gaiellaceae bacterium]
MALLAFLLPLAEDAATEGKKVITAMLLVGLLFLAVIALGELTHWLAHRRSARRAARPRY